MILTNDNYSEETLVEKPAIDLLGLLDVSEFDIEIGKQCDE